MISEEEIIEEFNEHQARQCNVIIHGLGENSVLKQDDKDKVSQIFKKNQTQRWNIGIMLFPNWYIIKRQNQTIESCPTIGR